MVTLTLLLRCNNSKYGHTEVKVGDQLTNNYVFLAVVVVQLAEWLFPTPEIQVLIQPTVNFLKNINLLQTVRED